MLKKVKSKKVWSKKILVKRNMSIKFLVKKIWFWADCLGADCLSLPCPLTHWTSETSKMSRWEFQNGQLGSDTDMRKDPDVQTLSEEIFQD